MEMREQRLLAYTAAAGLGAFAFGQLAQAEVVYVDLPDQSLLVRSNPAYGGEEISIDVDGDTDIDFKIQFVDFGTLYGSVRGRSMDFNLSLTNKAKGNTYYIRSFDIGDVIGFENANMAVCTGAGEILKPSDLPAGFAREVPSFMGIALHEDASPDYYFGWIRIQTLFHPATTEYPYGYPLGVTVYDMAYETTANLGITIVPEPGCLALLAAGLGAMGLRRRTA